jgi:glucose-6-phosphate dehydrogenase assembly protein OpcA
MDPALFSSAGLPVEIGQIERALGRLWEDNADTKTRASLINLAIYTENPARLAANQALVAHLASEHACRALLLLGNPSDTTSSAQAWIDAHCHVLGQSARQICSEQITFYLPGESAATLSNLVFAHLDSDLPLVFWWQADITPLLEQKIWPWVDRLLFDSAEWTEPSRPFHRLLESCPTQCAETPVRQTVLCDLNWTRLLGCRFALAALFDHHAALQELPRVNRLHLKHAPGARTAALLFLGWISSRLGWTLAPLLDRHVLVDAHSRPAGREITFALEEDYTAHHDFPLSSCLMASPNAEMTLSRPGGASFYQLGITIPGHPPISQLVQAEPEDLPNLILAELGRGGNHPGLHQALQIVLPLF